nr:hypothetical protein B0A51_14003 [Rachicladosporium sp. CCFEE 5018]
MTANDMAKLQEEAIDYASPIIVRVGAERHPFIINKDIPLDDQTEFCTLTLKDVEFKAFNVNANWLHSRMVYTRLGGARPREAYALLLRCYVLGDVLLDLDFKDALADAFICEVNTVAEGNRWLPSTETQKTLFANTIPTAKLRQLCVDIFAGCRDAKVLSADDPPDFLRSVAEALISGSSVNQRAMFADCKCHEHGEGEDACYRKRLFAAPRKPAEPPK